MNNFYTLIYLTAELKHKLIGSVFQTSLSPHKDVWEAFVSSKHETVRIIFSTHPSETALFYDRYRASKKSNVTSFFKPLEGQKITAITLADNDRFISFQFQDGHTLLFQLFGNKPNVFLIRDNLIVESFKSPEKYIHQPKPAPRQPPAQKPVSETMSPKKVILATDMKFPRHLIQPVIETYNLQTKSSEECRAIVNRLITAMLENAAFRVLSTGNICLLPQDLFPSENLNIFDTVTEAIRFAYYKTSGERRLSSKKQTIEPAINKQLKKLQAIMTELDQAEKGLDRAETYEQYGHILMANAHKKINPANNTFEAIDFYNNNETVQIPVKPSVSIAENAQSYYDKSSDSLRNVEESKRRLSEAKRDYKVLKALASSFEKIDRVYEFDEWYKENKQQLKKAGILSTSSRQKPTPYRKTEINGYEIWIGKSAKSNDKLTSASHKEDIWLHARGVAGSHVVIRMKNNKEMPPKSVLLKAASLAAWNSKARGSGLAPVIITKRKYVVKSKGLPAGAVRVQKEDVEMVPPQKL